MTITEFLEARIAEDELRAYDVLGEREGDRLLAECEAKRAIVKQRNRSDKSMSMDDWSMGWSDGNYAALYALAAVYKDHPDYQQEWAA